jgi:hypothetical protein
MPPAAAQRRAGEAESIAIIEIPIDPGALPLESIAIIEIPIDPGALQSPFFAYIQKNFYRSECTET